MTEALLQTKEIWVDSKQKVLSAKFTWASRFKHEILFVTFSLWNSNYSVVTSLSSLSFYCESFLWSRLSTLSKAYYVLGSRSPATLKLDKTQRDFIFTFLHNILQLALCVFFGVFRVQLPIRRSVSPNIHYMYVTFTWFFFLSNKTFI